MQKYPLDYEKLSKGDIIPESLIEEILETKSSSPNYKFKMIKLRDLIEEEMSNRGKPVTIRCDGNNLMVLDDLAAYEYNWNYRLAYLRRSEVRHDHLRGTIDIRNLNYDQRVRYLRSVELSSRFSSSINQTTKVIMGDDDVSAKTLPDIGEIKKLCW